jgi:hypothetical protein
MGRKRGQVCLYDPALSSRARTWPGPALGSKIGAVTSVENIEINGTYTDRSGRSFLHRKRAFMVRSSRRTYPSRRPYVPLTSRQPCVPEQYR